MVRALLAWAALCLAPVAGCGDEPPPGADGDADADGDGDADGDTDGDGDADLPPPAMFPLAPGTVWTYQEQAPAGGMRTLRKEVTGCESITFPDCESDDDVTFHTYVWESTGSANPDENGTAWVTVTAEGVFRVRQQMFSGGVLEFTQVYSPGFLRFPAPPLDEGRVVFDHHTRCETDEALGSTTPLSKDYSWAIETFEAVDVPAGHFDDCLRARRENVDTGETKLFWFCDGVGKVLEHSVNDLGEVLAYEELTDYTMGDDACTF